ncbi:MAG: glycosyltransferase family 39 protein [Acidobacteriota bacterium]
MYLILALAFGMRVYQASVTTYFWDEERDWIPLAESISFQPQSLNLPLRADYHGALPAYLMEIGGLLLGKDPLGFRFPGILAGVFSIYLAYRMSLDWAGVNAARWVAALLAFNEFHISMSTLAIQHIFYFLFVMAALYAFSRFLKTRRPRYLYWATGWLGVAFLCYEISALLVPVFVLTLLVLPEYRVWFKRKEPYLAGLVFLLVILPDLAANFIVPGTTLATYGDHLSRIGGVGFTPHYLNFFLRDGVRALYNWMGRELYDKAAGYPTMNLVFGVILLGGVLIETLRWRKQEPILKFLILSFWLVLAFFVLVRPGSARNRLDPVLWLWVGVTLLPACLIVARLFSDLRGRWLVAAATAIAAAVFISLTAVAVGHFGIPSVEVGSNPEFIWPPDGRIVAVQSKFTFCKICDSSRKIELVSIVTVDESASFTVSPSEYNSAGLCGRDCTINLPAILNAGEQVRDYEINFRLTDQSGGVQSLSDYVHVCCSANSSLFEFPAKFWTR